MTSEVIDAPPRRCLPEGMTLRYDRTLRVVMWLDAFLSFAVAALCMVASPVVAVVGLPYPVVAGFGVAAIACAVLLATCGAVTGVAIMRRMSAGVYGMPPNLRLPLPAGVHPPFPAALGNDVPQRHAFGQDRAGGPVR
jgi:hypothetical protein